MRASLIITALATAVSARHLNPVDSTHLQSPRDEIDGNIYDVCARNTATGTAEVAAAAATARTESPTSNVQGRAFNRIMQQGILLTQMYGVGAPSQPNYVAPASGDDFGVNSDSFLCVDKDISTVVDLLEDKGISWGDYNEGLPYTGFNGANFTNPTEGNYSRKHNLLQRFGSIQLDEERQAKVKNLTLFNEDLRNQRLPQWIFVTPNLSHDGHDTDITVSCNWTRSFVEPLLRDPYFNDNTVVYITWQANGQVATARNHVAGILLGSAVPPDYRGTYDSSYHNHYSEIASVEANWDLHTLGRWDVGANVWNFVAYRTGDIIRQWNILIANDLFENYYWNQSYGGIFSSALSGLHTYVKPNLAITRNRRTVLPKIAELWAKTKLPDYYKDIIELPDAFHPPKGFEVPIGLNPPAPIFTPIYEYPKMDRSDVNMS